MDIALEKEDPELVTIIRTHQFEIEQNMPSKRVNISSAVSSPINGENIGSDQPPVKPLPSSPVVISRNSEPNTFVEDYVNVTNPNTKSNRGSPTKSSISSSSSFSAAKSAAAAYAKGIMKTGFAKMHKDNQPIDPQHESENDDDELSLSQGNKHAYASISTEKHSADQFDKE